ncbi:hypothetical protein, partial [Mordavella massiliensis]|uniref:hypothetical protein n=1 Tax=Mordavella massiliensis TaxID=1871024 RepID=UPI00195E7D65
MYLVNFAFQSRVRRLEAQQKKVKDRYYSFVGSLQKNRDSSGHYGDGPAISDCTGRRGQKFVQWSETEAWAGQTALENGCFVLII